MNTKIKFALVMMLILLSPIKTTANEISEDSAKVIAECFFSNAVVNNTGKTSVSRKPLTRLKKRISNNKTDDGTASYYIFSRYESPGFVIIAGDDRMPSVIGYSLENDIDSDNMPDALKLWLDNYANYVGTSGTVKNEVGPLEPGTPIVGPYLRSQWNQKEPYNWFTPLSQSGKHTPTGCVPTAAAQVMYYYKWPQNSYSRVYDWDAMIDNYNDSYDEFEGRAVATLMRDLGYIMGTEYKEGGSSTYTSGYYNIPGYLCTQISNIDDLKENLSRGPLLITVDDEKDFRHSVVADGYDSNNLYHINWGWGGSYDGYYDLYDMAIIYKRKEIHPTIGPLFLLEPDYNNEKGMTTLAALGGVDVDVSTAEVGDTLNVFLHNLSIYSGSDFSGYVSAFIYKAPASEYDDYGKQVYGNEQFEDKKYTDFDYSYAWNNNNNGHDFNVRMALPELPENGEYVLVPTCYNTLEVPAYTGQKGGNWRPLLKFADETLAEDIPFEYKDGKYIFKEVKYGDFQIEVSNVLTASKYRKNGRSVMLADVKNFGENDFSGNLTFKLASEDVTKQDTTITIGLFAPAKESNHATLSHTFDFTGSYSIKSLEVWKKMPSGERKVFQSKAIEGAVFNVLPTDNLNNTKNISATMHVQIAEKDGIYFINDSIYKSEEVTVSYVVYSIYEDTVVVEIEIWDMPANDDKPQLLIAKSYHHSRSNGYALIGCQTANMSIGSHYLRGFIRCGNNTTVISRPDTIGEGYPDAITDNRILVMDPGIEIPTLELKGQWLFENYYDTFNNWELKIKNTGNVDYYGLTSDILKFSSFYSNSDMRIGCQPFTIKAGEEATLFPRVYLNIRESSSFEERLTDRLKYKMNNGVRDFYVPMDGTFKLQFTNEPVRRHSSATSISFYYKNNSSIKSHQGFLSKGILKRSLWKNGEMIIELSDLISDSTYATYDVCPSIEEIKDLPSDSYLLRVDLTDVNGVVWPSTVYPIILDDEMLPISIKNVSFDTDKSFDYKGQQGFPVSV